MTDDDKLRKVVISGIEDGLTEFDLCERVLQSRKQWNSSQALEFVKTTVLNLAKSVTDFVGNRSTNVTIAILRFTAIYERALRAEDFRAAIAAQKEVAKLQQLEDVPGDKPAARPVGNRGTSPSVAIQINTGNNQQSGNNQPEVQCLADLSEEELLRLAGTQEFPFDASVKPKRAAIPARMLDSEATLLLHSEDDSE